MFKEENDSNNLTLGPSLGDAITQVWTERERFSDGFAVTFFIPKEESLAAPELQIPMRFPPAAPHM